MGVFLSIISTIKGVVEAIKLLYDLWKKTLMRTPQEQVDKEKAKTDKEQEDFKAGKGGGDVEI